MNYKHILTEVRELSSTPMRLLFVILTIVALMVSAIEIVRELGAGQTLMEMFDDLALFVVASLVAIGLLMEWTYQRRALVDLQAQLTDARGKLQNIDERSHNIGRQYREVMQKQFDEWDLTESEQQIVISLLKGLSFREVASLRDTAEKTVRQQATGVYRKAGLRGRHELAAWFFEDLLEPQDNN